MGMYFNTPCVIAQGSVRTVVDGTGAVRQRFDYYPYGTVSRSWSSSSTDSPDKRYRFGGKEVTGYMMGSLIPPTIPFLDYGARLYSPGTAMWMSQDPMLEDYYPIGPYAYCAGNPVNLVDPEGTSIWIYSQEDQTYIQYLNGELYDMNGEKYNGSDGLVWLVCENINKLYELNDSKISDVLSTLEHSELKHTFVFNKRLQRRRLCSRQIWRKAN